MIRTQISLTEAQHERLHRVARERGVSVATVIREAVEAAVPDQDRLLQARQAKAFALAGAFHSGHADTASRHDEILAEAGAW
jgi:predicted DNA-binding protein